MSEAADDGKAPRATVERDVEEVPRRVKYVDRGPRPAYLGRAARIAAMSCSGACAAEASAPPQATATARIVP